MADHVPPGQRRARSVHQRELVDAEARRRGSSQALPRRRRSRQLRRHRGPGRHTPFLGPLCRRVPRVLRPRPGVRQGAGARATAGVRVRPRRRQRAAAAEGWNPAAWRAVAEAIADDHGMVGRRFPPRATPARSTARPRSAEPWRVATPALPDLPGRRGPRRAAPRHSPAGTRRCSSPRPAPARRRVVAAARCSTSRGSADGRIVDARTAPAGDARRGPAHGRSCSARTVGDTVGYQTRDERRIGPATRHRGGHRGRAHPPAAARPGAARRRRSSCSTRSTSATCRPTSAWRWRSTRRATLRPDLRIAGDVGDTATSAALRRCSATARRVVDERRAPAPRRRLRWRPPTATSAHRARPPPAPCGPALRDETGDVLVFLPGIGEIRRVEPAARRRRCPPTSTSPAGRRAVARPSRTSPWPRRRRAAAGSCCPPTSPRRRSPSTACASWSTAGWPASRASTPRTGMTRLTTVPTSRASADQRAGRAGRIEPGVRLPAVEQASSTARRPRPPRGGDHRGRPRRAGPRAGGLGHAGRTTCASSTPPPATDAARRRVELLGASSARSTTTAASPTSAGGCSACPCTRAWRAMIAGATPTPARRASSPPSSTSATCCAARPDELPADLAITLRASPDWASHERADRRAVERAREPRRRSRPPGRGIAFDTRAIDRRPGRRRCSLPPTPTGSPGRRPARAVPAPHRRRRRGRRTDDPLADERVRRRRRPRRRAGPRRGSGSPRRSTQTRSTQLADAGRANRSRWSGTRLATTSSNASSAGSTRCGSARRCAAGTPRRRDDGGARRAGDRHGPARCWHGHAGVAALRQRVGFLHRTHRRAVARLESDATLTRTLDEWLGPVPRAGRPAGPTSTALDVAMRAARSCRGRTDRGLDELAPPTLELPSGRTCRSTTPTTQPTARVRVQDVFGTARHPTVAGGRADRAAPALARRPADPGDRRSARLLGRQLGERPQGARRPLPQASVAGRSRPRRAEAHEGPLTRPLRCCSVAVGHL